MNSSIANESLSRKMSGADLFQAASQNIVYIWMRGAECLYVGASGAGLARLLNKHHVINVSEPLQDDDEIMFDYFHPGEFLQVEAALIESLNPKYNRKMTEKLEEVSCRTCKKLFMQKRRWQVCCSRECRQG